jgi:hypothetical protein
MSDELETLLKLVADGRLTAEEAAPIVAALEDWTRTESGPAGDGQTDGAPNARARTRGTGTGPAQSALSGRRLRVYVAQNGRPVVDLQIPLTAAGFAIDQVPGLSPDHRSRIVEAIQSGLSGPILEVSDGGDEVRIVIE